VKQRDFPLCLVIKLLDRRRESFLIATDNEKEVLAWAQAINSTGRVDVGLEPSFDTTQIFETSHQLRDQLTMAGGARVTAADGGGSGGGCGGRGDERPVQGDDLVDMLIQLDDVTGQRDECQAQNRALQQALALLLPAADLAQVSLCQLQIDTLGVDVLLTAIIWYKLDAGHF
jgi:hypothetical protein